MDAYFVYIMANRGRTTLYIGVTNSLMRRVSQHRAGESPGFSQRYNTNRLMYYEQFNDVRDAIAREKQLKGWSRSKKEALINGLNPKWADLGVAVLGLADAPPRPWQDRGGRQARDTSLRLRSGQASSGWQKQEPQHVGGTPVKWIPQLIVLMTKYPNTQARKKPEYRIFKPFMDDSESIGLSDRARKRCR